MRRLVVIFISLFAFSFCARSQEVFVLRDGMPITPLSGHLELFLDSTANMKIEEVINSGKFYLSKEATPNLGITKSAVWVKFSLKNSGNSEFLYETGNSGASIVDLYEVSSGNTIRKNTLTAIDDFKKREFGVNLDFFKLHIPKDSTQVYYVRYADVPPIQLILSVGTEDDYFGYSSLYNLLNGFFYGIIILMVVYNLFLFFSDMDFVYILYVVYTLLNGIFVAAINGYFVYFPKTLAHFLNSYPTLTPALLGTFAMAFTLKFLEVKKNIPKVYWPYSSLVILVICAFLLDLFGNHHLGMKFVQVAGLSFSLASMGIAIVIYRKKYKPARFYLIGFGAYLAGLFIFILLDAGVIEYNVFAKHSVQIGSAIEAILLSFAIGDKMHRFKMEKQAAQLEALNAAKENARMVSEQNIILEKKVEARTHEIQIQSGIIEEKNKDILSSIHYAKRIQRALLASDTLLKNNLPDYFILYKPKDIVSGDFYWADEAPDGKFLLLTGDCTGHGVPGAFMSLLNISIVHELTFSHRLSRPDLLLNTQRDAIIMSLNPEGADEQSKDGMDCILCSFDFPNKKMEFAMANNPLWILRNGELIEYKPDKQPVGLYEESKKDFTLHTVQLQKGDIIYTLTDGFADQFGGPKGKKFKDSQLKEKLLEICNHPLDQQKIILEKTFEDWKGNLEQVDDVLVIGIKI